MTTNAQDKDIPDIQELITKHQDKIEHQKFVKYLDRAKLAYDQFYAAVYTKDIQNRISTELSNVRLIDYLWSTLLNDLMQSAEEVSDPEQKQEFLKDIKTMQKNFLQFIPKFRLQSQGLKQDFHEMFPHFNWHGDYATFFSHEELGRFAETLCHELIKSGNKTVKFEVYLPTPSRQEQENEKHAPRERGLPYAKKVFAAAAKAGFPPDDIELFIDNKKIDPKHEDFKSEYADWKKTSLFAVKTKIEKSTGRKLANQDETEENETRYKP